MFPRFTHGNTRPLTRVSPCTFGDCTNGNVLCERLTFNNIIVKTLPVNCSSQALDKPILTRRQTVPLCPMNQKDSISKLLFSFSDSFQTPAGHRFEIRLGVFNAVFDIPGKEKGWSCHYRELDRERTNAGKPDFAIRGRHRKETDRDTLASSCLSRSGSGCWKEVK